MRCLLVSIDVRRFDINQLHLVAAPVTAEARFDRVLGTGDELRPSILLPLQARFEPTISTHDSNVSHDFSST